MDNELVRVCTIGNVDDGKSTLVGRLLWETESVHEDHVAAVRAASERHEREGVDLAFLTDGLRAEREQGITIDVAYRHFQTDRRHFIIADSPGHEQYTRNMVTGASTANVALLIVDARHGLRRQSRRHAFIASLLGIPHVIVIVNKMDLVDWSEETFEAIRDEYDDFAAKLDIEDLTYIPVSAAAGDNVVTSSERMPWYRGLTVLDALHSVYVGADRNLVDLRLPVQRVVRHGSDYRGYAGQIASGVVRPGDDVMVLPAGVRSRVASVDVFDGELDRAAAPTSVTLRLEDEVDVSRGDMIVHAKNRPHVTREVDAILVWMHDQPFRPGRPYVIKHTTSTVRGQFPDLAFRIDPETLRRQEADGLELNEIGRVTLETWSPLVWDSYGRNRHTGSFIAIDPVSNATVAAGMIIDRGRQQLAPGELRSARPVSRNITEVESQIAIDDRARLLGHGVATVWLTGLSGAGKSTVAYALERALVARGCMAYVLDGDNLRHGLNRDLGFAPHERRENIRRVAEVARLFNDAGVIAVSSFISPYREDRAGAREIVGDDFIEVFVDAPVEVCEERDPKGLYKKARAGEIPSFTGVSAPYEEPEAPDVRLRTDRVTPEEAVEQVIEHLVSRGVLR